MVGKPGIEPRTRCLRGRPLASLSYFPIELVGNYFSALPADNTLFDSQCYPGTVPTFKISVDAGGWDLPTLHIKLTNHSTLLGSSTHHILVPETGLEPVRLSTGDFKSPMCYQFHHSGVINNNQIPNGIFSIAYAI